MKFIEVSTKKYPGAFCMVDDADFERLSAHKWTAGPVGRRKQALVAYRRVKDEAGSYLLLMHREIMDCRNELVVDHRDGNALNNQRENLRICTQQQNTFNHHSRRGKSKYKGVAKHQNTEKWRAYLVRNGKQRHLGFFQSEDDAAVAHDLAANLLHGEFANMNFPDGEGIPPNAMNVAYQTMQRLISKGVVEYVQ